MKLKFKIVALVFSLLIAFFGGSANTYASDDLDNSTGLSTISNEAPSESFLSRSKRSMALEVQGVSSSSSTTFGANPFSVSEAFTDSGEVSPGNMGGSPIGDATLPIILSLILLFFVYRGVTINKRKNL